MTNQDRNAQVANLRRLVELAPASRRDVYANAADRIEADGRLIAELMEAISQSSEVDK